MQNEEKCVFGITEDKQTVILGIPTAAWQYMQDGKTHTFDLTSLGVPIRIMLFGCKDQQAARALLNTDKETLDLTGLDFGFGSRE